MADTYDYKKKQNPLHIIQAVRDDYKFLRGEHSLLKSEFTAFRHEFTGLTTSVGVASSDIKLIKADWAAFDIAKMLEDRRNPNPEEQRRRAVRNVAAAQANLNRAQDPLYSGQSEAKMRRAQRQLEKAEKQAKRARDLIQEAERVDRAFRNLDGTIGAVQRRLTRMAG